PKRSRYSFLSTSPGCAGVGCAIAPFYALPRSGGRRRKPELGLRNERLRLGIVRVREKQLLPVHLIRGNVALSLRRDEVIDEPLSHLLFHLRMFCRIDEHYTVLVEQPRVSLDVHLQIRFVVEVNPGCSVGQQVGAPRGGYVERSAHALPDRLVPSPTILLD